MQGDSRGQSSDIGARSRFTSLGLYQCEFPALGQRAAVLEDANFMGEAGGEIHRNPATVFASFP